MVNCKMRNDYCYLNDAMGFEDERFKKPEDYKICNDKKVCSVKTTICGECYKDPDAVSKKLYIDMSKLFSKSFRQNDSQKDLKVEPNVEKNNVKQWYLQYDDEYEHQLSIDYIGPSRKTALKQLENDKESKSEQIGKFLLSCRTVGGHIFWPAHQRKISEIKEKLTINQIRGGLPIYDRIDVTLAELKNYFDTNGEGQPQYNEALFNAFKRYQDWFSLFEDKEDVNKSFKNYINYFVLNSFVDENKNYEVLSLATSKLDEKNPSQILKKYISEEFPECIGIAKFNYLPSNYKLFIQNSEKVILERSEALLKSI